MYKIDINVTVDSMVSLPTTLEIIQFKKIMIVIEAWKHSNHGVGDLYQMVVLYKNRKKETSSRPNFAFRFHLNEGIVPLKSGNLMVRSEDASFLNYDQTGPNAQSAKKASSL
ncbi:hypothetical protein P5673_011634 [Acropora cervicornis]|uniref:Uncharacterized protein n=1 Tax=Acropora cervicornis TaxID=6130 RepID=A0AAD9QPV6_ACRCE|nr:hypothetical protein P5673_011634 [Acropora cervicornis]